MVFKELVFITGKGGTGKTSIALKLSKWLSEKGHRVLFVELKSQSSAQSLLGLKNSPEYNPTPTGLGFDWSLIQGLDCLSEYAGYLIKLKSISDYLFTHPFVHKMLEVAPGLNDLAVLGKLTSHIRNHGPPMNYDNVIVDGFSTGSFTSFLTAPETLELAMGMSFLQKQSFSIKEALRNREKTQYFFISLFEEGSVDEVQEVLTDENFKDYNQSQLAVIMNNYIGIEKALLPNPQWQDFVKKKLAFQKKQMTRASHFFKKIYIVDKHILPLKDQIKKKQGGFLRTPLNHSLNKTD